MTGVGMLLSNCKHNISTQLSSFESGERSNLTEREFNIMDRVRAGLPVGCAQNRRVSPPTICLGGRTTRSSSWIDWWAADSWMNSRTESSISHLEVVKFMIISD